MKDLVATVLAGLAVASVPLGAGEKATVDLTAEHTNAAKTFTISTPPDWEFETRAGLPEFSEARGGPLVLRILRRDGELGLDGYHVQCMLERLAGPMETQPQVDYEYDFRQGWIGERQALDSAFTVHYDEAIEGYRDWRQRNVTVVGKGESLCVVAMAPSRVWKKSREDRELLEAVMTSVRLP
jgi:hypothetical protein